MKIRQARGTTLQRQIILLLLLAIVLLSTVTIVYYSGANAILSERSEAYFATIFSLVESRVNAIVNNTALVSQTLAANSTLNKYLQSGSADLAPFVQNLLMETILNSVAGADGNDRGNIFDGIYLVRNDFCLRAEKTDLSSVYNAIMRDYKLDSRVYNASNYTRIYRRTPTGEYYYAVIQPIKYKPDNLSPYSSATGYCVYFCNAGLIQERLFSTGIPSNAMLYLYDYDYHTVASSNSALIGRSMISNLDLSVSLNALSKNTQELYSNGEKTLCRLTTIPSSEWKLLLLIPYAGLTSDLNQLLRSGILFCAIALCVMLVIAIFVVRENMREVRAIVGGLQHVENLDNHYRLPPSYVEEFDLISGSINKMLTQLECTIAESMEAKERLFANEILKKNAELYALQTQINPHFLYNTLGCISGIAQYYKIQEIEKIANAMASIFRYCIKRDEFASLSDELRCIREYLDIIDLRFPDRMRFFIDIPAQFLEYRILKMTLQPLVENAIQHGLCRINRIGILKIGCEADATHFRIIVRDNGIGIDAETYARLQDSLAKRANAEIDDRNESIGLMNIHERLRLAFGSAYGVTVESEPEKGTTVYLNMPIMEAAEN